MKYIDLMEMALSAYTDEHIMCYFNEVKTNGLTEHGFPRLTANIGILIAHHRRLDLLPVFLDMMEFCCKTIPTVKAANDFSVREIICCLLEIERQHIVCPEITEIWRSHLRKIVPQETYHQYAKSPTDKVRNWALYTATSEFFRQGAGLCHSEAFIELQLLQQAQWLDENGMYMDGDMVNNQHPILYDLVARGLFSLLFDQGYRGEMYDAIDSRLKKAALLTLDMQSPNGEIPFGGRSNQFVFNEAWMIVIFEYEAKRYARGGDMEMAARFKVASARALAVIESWLQQDRIKHIKNHYPTETQYGCENYAYFDKYMISVASFLYVAYLICDESIPYTLAEDVKPCCAETSYRFHKIFLKSGGYGLEFDLNADPHYDANGLGRIHRVGAPSSICMSCPCPAKPNYVVDIEKPMAFSLCSAVDENGVWVFGAEVGNTYEQLDSETTEKEATLKLLCRFLNGKTTEESYVVGEKGITVTIRGEGEIGFALPALDKDGEKHTEVSYDEHTLSVAYNGWLCRYTTNGMVMDLHQTAANRNGHYKVFLAKSQYILRVTVEIVRVG